MTGEVVKVGYLMQDEIFIVRNLVNTSDEFRGCIPCQCVVTSSLVLFNTIFRFSVQLKIDQNFFCPYF